ncbi:hypothetical protein OO015_09700 [Thermomicrobium sp. 4228-Ro]|uniref:hypothetical protein n=1 Tax=Thermomicrobium sp. 4228-Ro TaxID=2993937 RepID=UPI002248977E|nr:hypothetical protein [Thermomicrobium sp. 4228-Ro]MCX2727759.1 hypothetical protein [Thermomicrobium sp. 4228-Ro]
MRAEGDRRWLLLVLALAALAWVVVGWRYLVRLEPLTGDEPYYVVTAISLLEDGDLDETNQYAERVWLRFYPPQPVPADWQGWPSFPWDLPPHAAHAARPGLYSKHGLGPALLVAVPLLFAGRVGAMAAIGLCGILLVGQLYLLARETGAGPRLAAALALGTGLTMPIGPYALLIFPEVPAAFCLLYAVRRLAARENRWWQWLLTGSAIGFLPWLHQRFVFSAALLGVVALARAVAARWGRAPVTDWPRALWAVGPALVGGLGIVGYDLWLYGQPYQNTSDHAGFSDLVGTLNGAGGLLLDAQWGLLVAAPVYLAALAAVSLWWARQPRLAGLVAAVALPYLVLVAAYRVWWGEWGPPARYLVPVAAFAVAPLASWLGQARPWARLVVAVLWGWGALLTTIGYLDPQRFYHHPDGVNKLYRTLDSWLGTAFAEWLVPFQPFAQAPASVRLAVSGLALGLLGVLAMVVAWSVETAEAGTGQERGVVRVDRVE